jgi:hypothetical protein
MKGFDGDREILFLANRYSSAERRTNNMSEELQELEEADRHPIRFLIKLAAFVGLLYAVGRFLAQKKDEYAGLTESEARDKFMDKMAPRVGEDQAAEIADQVIPKLKERGLIKSDPKDATAADAKAAAEDASETNTEKTDEDSDKVSDAVDSVVKD